MSSVCTDAANWILLVCDLWVPQARRFQGYIRGIPVSSQDGIHGKNHRRRGSISLRSWHANSDVNPQPSKVAYSPGLSKPRLDLPARPTSPRRQSRLAHHIPHLTVSIARCLLFLFDTLWLLPLTPSAAHVRVLLLHSDAPLRLGSPHQSVFGKCRPRTADKRSCSRWRQRALCVQFGIHPARPGEGGC